MRAILVGRHAGEVPGVDVVGQRAITWPAAGWECAEPLAALFRDAIAADAAVVFQNVPGQVAACLARMTAARAENAPVPWPAGGVGIIVSVPGERPGRVSRRFLTDSPDTMVSAVLFSNPRAIASGHSGVVSVEIDGPPMPFQFSHIEWLD